jgi:hypothetical protein
MDGLTIAFYFGEKAGQGAGKGYESRGKVRGAPRKIPSHLIQSITIHPIQFK